MKTQNSQNGPKQAKASLTADSPPLTQIGPAAGEPYRSQAGPASGSPAPSPPPDGGQTTISPPAKIPPDGVDTPDVLASGIDTLYLSMNISWGTKDFFRQLNESKAEALEQGDEQQIPIKDESSGYEWKFNIKPHGVMRYKWLILNNEYTLKIGDWPEPQSIPSVLVEIRSETLWSHGFQKSVNRIVNLLESKGAFIHDVKPSRVDLCVDILLPEKIWSIDLIPFKVTKASYTSPHFVHNNLTGISIGKGTISARLYDKPQEIRQKKDKEWMFDIWGISEVPEGQKIIRIEFQIRRELLKRIGIDDIHDLYEKVQNLWGYCTQDWLKFQDNPGKQSKQRKNLDWWVKVQNGFMGFQNPEPLVRSTAASEDKKQLVCQMYGLATSFCAIDRGKSETPQNPVHIGEILRGILKELEKAGKTTGTLQQDIEEKQAKYQRTRPDTKASVNDRSEVAYPHIPFKPRTKNKSSP